jgi:hypothetical protein
MNSEPALKDGLSPLSSKFFKDFFKYYRRYSAHLSRENDNKIGTAVIFEKFRAAVEYQEEHLIFKNAISRIIRRNLALTPHVKAKDLLSQVSTELIWANYIQPDTLKNGLWEKIENVMERYLAMINNLPINFPKNSEATKLLIEFSACEIQELIHPRVQEQIFVRYAGDTLAGYFKDDNIDISTTDHIIQIKNTIYSTIFKPDAGLLKYWTLLQIDPNWKTRSLTDLIKISQRIDVFLEKINDQIEHPYRDRYLYAFKNVAAPYRVLLNSLISGYYDVEKIETNPSAFQKFCMTNYDSMRKISRSTVWRGVFRALIFILLTKFILAFIVEIPFDRLLHDQVAWNVLAINLSFPPILMLLAGLSIPQINPKNRISIQKSLHEIIFSSKLDVKEFDLRRPVKRRSERLFDSLFTVFSIVLIILAIWLLVKLQFNFVSITLFFIFVSAVSFLSFRIRTASKELVMIRKRDDTVTSVVELIFLPFIRMGRRMSNELTRHNPMLFALDFMIETPLKTLIKILRSWFNFVSKKKEEMEY